MKILRLLFYYVYLFSKHSATFFYFSAFLSGTKNTKIKELRSNING